MIGFDTGFFLALLKGNNKAVNIWKIVVDGQLDAATSCLSIFEIKKLSLKGILSRQDADDIITAMFAVTHVVWIQNVELCTYAAKLSWGTAIPAIDSIILASMLTAGVNKLYTTDSHFINYNKKGFDIVLL